ncbi:iron complex outermembrane recepter protein [Abyssogena phaseoliformis symbiont OG214]|uniref:TonB-dependent receptor plug domain-containing protein n=1 Tax=Abyssogena phaseoliformis symbiont TaxID=596095 RepID=UPI0019154A64|nr:TonB-dependent receptor [Abyssogena phaseoliformis symbiont]BBB22607.1 iron complex outermembrane recepter protein [Abyssogena phaseoliformis symbiont OG214]
MQKILPIVTLIASLNANSTLGPIPIYLNTEYRTDSPVIGSIASTLSFNASDIKATGANTFLDFLATVPSVGLHQGSVPAIFMRGGHSNHTLVLVDGVSINSTASINGAVEYGLTSIALNDIKKIEIIKGSGSVLYGSGAIAGVISITTKKGADGKSAAVSTKFGTHNSKTYALSASSGNKNGFVRFTHNKYTTDGIDTRDSDTTNDKDGISNRTTKIKLGNEHFDVSYLESRNRTEYDRCWNDTATVDDCSGNRESNKIMINTNKKISNIWHAKLSLAQTKSNRDTQHGTIFTSGDKYKSTTITILNGIKVDDALFNVGLSQVNDENTTDSKKLSSKDLFINWQKNINDININIGARHTKHNKFGSHTIYNTGTGIGIGKYLDSGFKLTANYSTAFQAPTLFQLFNQPEPSFGAYYGNGNPNLKPETSKNIELGIEKQQDWGLIGIKVYNNKVNNAIAYDTSGGTSSANIPHYFNRDKLSTKGIELSINANIATYNINFSHNYNKSKENDSNTQSIRRPKNTTNLTINKQHGKFNSRIQVIRKSFSIDDNKMLDGYTLVNLSSNYSLNDQVKISLNIKNALDKNYITATDFNGAYNQLGRTIEMGLDYQF